jgi:hypothetical protein
MTTIKLTGDFSRGQLMAELFSEMEDAKATLDAIVAAGDHGSEEYHDALKAFKAAQAAHSKCRDSLRAMRY